MRIERVETTDGCKSAGDVGWKGSGDVGWKGAVVIP